jgi:hypothetical protein
MTRVSVTVLIAAACLAAPAVCLAAPSVTPTATSASIGSTAINLHADRTALNAYATYLQAMVADRLVGTQAEQTFAATATSTCYRALAPIATSSTVPPGTTTALTDIGDEIGADAGLEFLTSASTPFSRLAATLTPLRWGTATPATTVRRFLAANTALLAIQPSNLCGDALSVASEAGEPEVTAPPATVTFLSSYQAGTGLANTRLAAFVKLLDIYATNSDRSLATRVNTLADRINKLSGTAITAGTKALFIALGIPLSQS